MKRIFLMMSIVLGLCSVTLNPPAKWKVVKDRSLVKYVIPKGGPDSGRFTVVNADVIFDPAEPSKASFKASVDVSSIVTDDAGKTAHVLSADFFDAENYPAITFTSNKVSVKDSTWIMEGKLQMKKVKKKINFPFRFKETDEGGIFTGEMQVSAGDFGVMKKSKTGADIVNVSLEIHVVKE